MNISIYISKDFVNEETLIYKPTNVENSHIYKTYKDEETQHDQLFYRVDNTTKTTLSELYAEGWTLKQVTNPQGFWHIFFLEKV